jgi:hypothetical protein
MQDVAMVIETYIMATFASILMFPIGLFLTLMPLQILLELM